MAGESNGSSSATSSGAAKGWFTREDRSTAAVLGWAAAILGFVVGILTGASGPHPTVVAAVLPAVLSAVGGAAAYLATKDDGDPQRMRGIGWLVILFSVGLLVGSHVGTVRRESQDQTAWLEAQQYARDRHIEDLRLCTTREFQVNDQRKVLGLPPLTFSQVCPFLDALQPKRLNAAR